MSPQADYVVSNGTGAAVRSDINGQLAAIVSNNSGASAPATTYAYMLWADTSTNLLKLRNGANSAWITVGDLTAANLGLATLASPTFTGTATIPTLTVSTAANIPLGSAASPTLYFTGDSNTGLYSPGADQVALSTGGTGRLFIDSSGRCGIGASTPGSLLQVGQGTASTYTDFAIIGATTANYGPKISLQHGGSEIFEIANYGRVQGGTSSDVLVETVGSNKLQLGTNRTVALTIDTSQRVGIGVTSVSNTLHIKQTGDTYGDGIAIQAASGTARRLYIGVDHATGEGAIGTDTHDLRLEATGARSVTFKTNGSERARVDSSGRWLVGTSTAQGLANLQIEGDVDTAKLYLRRNLTNAQITTSGQVHLGMIEFGNASGAVGARIQANNDTDSGWGTNDYPTRLVFSVTRDGQASPTEALRISNTGVTGVYSSATGFLVGVTPGAGTSTPIMQAGYSASAINTFTTSFYIWSNGNVQNTNNSYTAISDIKLKENIVDANSQWDDIKALQVRNYNLKEGQTHRQIGLIAQEVEPISPGLVYESPDRDAEGNDLGTVTKSVNYSVLYMKAVKALQEAMLRIEDLEARLNAANL